MTLETLSDHFADITDDALYEVVHERSSEYTAQALELARAEAARRGLLDSARRIPTADGTPAPADRMTRSAGPRWLGVIGLLSLGNVAVAALGSSNAFVVGLGVTQIVDAVFAEVSPSLRAVGVVINVLAASMFFGLQFLARRSRAAFVLGIVLYAADALLMLLLQWWQGFAFHILILLLMVRRLQADRTSPIPVPG